MPTRLVRPHIGQQGNRLTNQATRVSPSTLQQQQQQQQQQPTENELRRASSLLNRLIKSITPYKTGRLRRSIRSFRKGSDRLHPRTAVHYAVYQEIGTRYIKAKRFFRRAIRTFRRSHPNIPIDRVEMRIPSRYYSSYDRRTYRARRDSNSRLTRRDRRGR